MTKFLAVVSIISEMGGGRPDQGLPGGGGPVDPGWGIDEGAGPDQGLPGGRPPHIWGGGGRPPRPDQGLPGGGGRPAHPWIPPGGRPDQPIFLPPGIWPVPPGTPGGGTPTNPIWLPEGGTKPVEPDEGQPDQGLPPTGETPDQGLPEGGTPPTAGQLPELPQLDSFALLYSAKHGVWLLVTPKGMATNAPVRPDQGLPEEPKPTPKRR